MKRHLVLHAVGETDKFNAEAQRSRGAGEKFKKSVKIRPIRFAEGTPLAIRVPF